VVIGGGMDSILLKLADLGPLGIISAVLIYDVFYLQRRLLQIIENNTKAMQDLKSFCANRKSTMPEVLI
jgi:hypothetical protein